MSVPFQYFGSGAHMSAELKRTIHRVRTERPDLFVKQKVVETSMDGEGKVTTTERWEPKAVAPSGARRHHMSLQREWH
jgi:hypothetical protein